MRNLLVGVVGSIGLFVFLFMAFDVKDRFLYYPAKYPRGEWERQTQAGGEERWITAADGTRLNCVWYPQPQARFATLFFQGNAGNSTHRIDTAASVREAGSAFFIVGYRGYGKSEGKPSESGLYQDADAACAELIRLGYPPGRIVLHGESLGAAVATDLASRKPSAGLILEAPFISVNKMAGLVIPLIGPLLARGFDTGSKIARVHVPLLIMQGDADEVIPFSHGQTVFRQANEPKQFWQVPGGHHNDLREVTGPEYVSRLKAFYASLKRNP